MSLNGCAFTVFLIVFVRYAMIKYWYKDLLGLLGRAAGLRLRGGASSDSENEHHITQVFKLVDQESAESKQMQARQCDCMAAARRALLAEDDILLSMPVLDLGNV